MKKTTAKAFKELMIEVYGEFDYDILINKLSMLEEFQCKEYREKGCDLIAKRQEERSIALYDYLDNKGYYKDCNLIK